ncbi:MAG TPA: trehalose-phosphatase [Terriglobales bacterium]|nr:trehalose-phosphatase [Terriglobales bacterium]
MTGVTQTDRLAPFFDRLRVAPSRILLLDYDGTLAPFQIDRDRAFPYPGVPALIDRIMASGTRVVFVTGRPVREVLLLSGLRRQPEVWGSHGLERLKPDGSYSVDKVTPDQEAGLQQAREGLRLHGLKNRMELKPGAVALHWRGLAPQQIDELRATVGELWYPLEKSYQLDLLAFDGGLELRVRGNDKAKAVAAILGESDPDSVVAYLGDDRTDEDAFRALQGKGLTVLVQTQPRPTLADIQLRPPQELIQFFKEWLAAS